ncbi:MAG: peptidase M17, partial [Proteobacteria bacterium]|nr:peptidase M17 [Pseudomonadota bacterium]
MTSTKLTLTRKKPETFSGDLLVCCFEQDKNEKIKVNRSPVENELKKAIALGDFKGTDGNTLVFYPQVSEKRKLSAKRLLFVGLGKQESDKLSSARERCRCCGGTIAEKAAELKANKLFLCLPEVQGLNEEEIVECLVEGILLGDYRFLKYKKPDEKEPPFQAIKEIEISASSSGKGLRRAILHGQQAAEAGRKARDMANEPGNGWTPTSFAEYAQTLAKKHEMHCTVLDKTDMKELKMGGILGVNQGSAEPPKMVILEYRAS